MAYNGKIKREQFKELQQKNIEKLDREKMLKENEARFKKEEKSLKRKQRMLELKNAKDQKDKEKKEVRKRTPLRTPPRAYTRAYTRVPLIAPSIVPSRAPSRAPLIAPSIVPSRAPLIAPSIVPSRAPSRATSRSPSRAPSIYPSRAPSIYPSISQKELGYTSRTIRASNQKRKAAFLLMLQKETEEEKSKAIIAEIEAEIEKLEALKAERKTKEKAERKAREKAERKVEREAKKPKTKADEEIEAINSLEKRTKAIISLIRNKKKQSIFIPDNADYPNIFRPYTLSNEEISDSLKSYFPDNTNISLKYYKSLRASIISREREKEDDDEVTGETITNLDNCIICSGLLLKNDAYYPYHSPVNKKQVAQHCPFHMHCAIDYIINKKLEPQIKCPCCNIFFTNFVKKY